MIRSLSLFILLLASPILLAQPLYKWVEDDGSITFSVKPPPEGVTFETVDANSEDVNTITSPDRKPHRLAENLPAQRSVATITRAAPEINAPAARQNDYQNPSVDASAARRSSSAGRENTAAQTTTLYAGEAGSQKQRQCEDLQKRIVSLERRLRQSLSPEDMDNTVVYMARYQRSLDQHCAQ